MATTELIFVPLHRREQGLLREYFMLNEDELMEIFFFLMECPFLMLLLRRINSEIFMVKS